MRWFAFVILLALALAVQSSLAMRWRVAGARPDLLLPVVVFIALYGRSREALLSGWVTGLAADLLSIERFGVFTLTYLTVAFVVLLIRPWVMRTNLVAQFLLVFVMAAGCEAAWTVYRAYAGIGLRRPVSADAMLVLVTAAWTGLLGMITLQILVRLRKTFGFSGWRYRRALSRRYR